ncbi:haloacid dehalogenase superfamily, subfamily IA, variant 3 with third motif having DD or ED/haloacid dehalogenase superfamily, subfamily IA, variant 1 with third motif having Dx(3-4)D or Dx(3-4)E [Pedococcus dokdonensis]|uniref:Haloacid dehalogenase superfamily, subfamily IA, variant 3 with third motif having DD or ED/haloacid dehalogenase superfamily, subfamily IA, variant 1 with third motif having Dx(3-4)D or Dx(3-4)E n=1 Tax=Pedococcus dokdonensis TaxID=443156 RepID=A0A1H0SS25_9MICO|nr:HAD family hydrolase [Pedococcus dokdonensis]SDP44058.1 haloacid dehalogenase superfamily, subfamily IA, variant 3 with third motif having DD or ED/haloacid dehalogenase superfamily, subfamily IA, variant 1 with third motif having Dx(3-4)D or Dx(3-4)E [Pedococcus dokdonensis]
MSDSLTRASGIVFDLDGTLVDSTYVHTLCWWEALQQFGHERPMAAVHHTVGMGADHLLDHLLGDGRDRSQDDAVTAAHDVLFSTWHERLHPLPSARTLLNWCRDAGLTVGLASSGGQRDLWAMMDVLDHPDFDVIVTGDDVDSTKPDTDVLDAALDRAGLDAEDVLVVGDSVWDMQAARRAGVVPVGVATGGTSAPELESAGAELTYQDLAALLDALQEAKPAPVAGTWGARP